jgi:hypothetical protein
LNDDRAGPADRASDNGARRAANRGAHRAADNRAGRGASDRARHGALTVGEGEARHSDRENGEGQDN